MKRIMLFVIPVVIIFLAVVSLPAFTGLAADWFWFQAIGYETVFTKRLVWQAALGIGAGLIAFTFLLVNLRMALRGIVPDPIVVQLRAARPTIDPDRFLKRLAWPIALVLASISDVLRNRSVIPIFTF